MTVNYQRERRNIMPEKTITFIGWGSLIWNPGTLPTRGVWWDDGPLLPIEFARQSNDGRLTLVTHNSFAFVRTYWTIADVSNLESAISELREREGVMKKNEDEHIGYWSSETRSSNISEPFVDKISQWALEKNIHAVVWTALPPKFDNEPNRISTIREALQYLEELPHSKKEAARNYVINTPKQIDTPFRRIFNSKLNWRFEEQ